MERSEKERVQMKSRKTTLALTVGLLAGAVALSVWKFPREQRLLEHAVRIEEAKDWKDYHWISPHEVVYTTNERPHARGMFTRLDLATHQQTPLTEINHRIGPHDIDSWEVSPDGSRMAWTTHDGSSKKILNVCRLDGSEYAQWPDRWLQAEAHWTPDSRQLLVFRAVNPPPPKKRGDNNDTPLYEDAVLRAPSQTSGGQTLLLPKPRLAEFKTESAYYVTPDNGLIVDSTECTCHATQLELSRFTVRPNLTHVRHLTTDRPYSGHIVAHKLSPGGQHVAWSVQHEYVIPYTKLLRHYFPKIKENKQSVIGMYVSDLDGTNMRDLGHVPIPHSDNVDNDDVTEPGTLEWLPDGKTLSFTYKNALYTVASE
jgi:hypothetical protein